MSEENKKDEWHLKKLEIEFQQWGEDKGKYTGEITFQNGERESFKFKVRPNMAHDYIRAIAVDLVMSADNLASRLKASLEDQGLIETEN